MLQVILIKCDSCCKPTSNFSDKSNWFGKYLKPNESQICPNCIRDRDGYAQEFLEKIGVPVDTLVEVP